MEERQKERKDRSHLENSVHDDGNEHVEENGAHVLDAVSVIRNLRFFRRLGSVQRHVMTHGNEQLRDRRRHLGWLNDMHGIWIHSFHNDGISVVTVI